MGLCPSAIKLYKVMWQEAAKDQEGICRYGHNRLVQVAGLDKKSVIKAVRELLDAGLLQFVGTREDSSRWYRPTSKEHLAAQRRVVRRFEEPMHEVVEALAKAFVVNPPMVALNPDGSDPWDTVLAGAVVGANFGGTSLSSYPPLN